jgi:hypothetical protein
MMCDTSGFDDLLRDSDFVLAELARGQIPITAKLPDVMAATDNLSGTIKAFRDAPEAQKDLGSLEKALSQLMGLLAPITIQTLRDTGCDGPATSTQPDSAKQFSAMSLKPWFGRRSSVAYRFSTLFFWFTIVIVTAALTSSYWAEQSINMPGVLKTWDFKTFGHIIAPFTYGAMGACVYLLRSLHKHIYGRTFDRRRKPEYFNRVLLGAISGGATVLLLSSGKASAVTISFNALGFLAGYHTDLLFTAIERITNAVLPKAPDPQVPQQ